LLRPSPAKVAIIGGGCASIAAAFELSRPEHRGKYDITVYQLGWRLGGKGASGRGVANRIEEHGLHIWLGFYENAFRLVRECYAELARDPRTCRFSDWQDVFVPEAFIGIADRSRGQSWRHWLAYFPPGDGLPGDPLLGHNPFSIDSYLVRTATLLRTLLEAVQSREKSPAHDTSDIIARRRKNRSAKAARIEPSPSTTRKELQDAIARALKLVLLATTAGLVEAAGIIEALFNATKLPSNAIVILLETIAKNVRRQFETLIDDDDEMGRLWEVIDLVLAIMLGLLRSGAMTDPRGLDILDELDCREWLKISGASARSVDSALVRALYDLAFAYEDGDFSRPRLAAGQAIRGSLRMFLTYRGALFWKMRTGMGDAVFAPYYEVLKKRGVSFKFFHRLRKLKLAESSSLARSEHPYVESLHFDVQAETRSGSEYRPLIDINGLPCWPAKPDYSQLVDGEKLSSDNHDFESHWESRRVGNRILRVSEDFDYVVLGIGLGAVPYVCKDLIARDKRWSNMVAHVKTVATQAFQVWLREDMETLGWTEPQATVSGFAQPFDTWADMRQLIPEESFLIRPRAIAYFCSTMPEPAKAYHSTDRTYPLLLREEVRRNAIRFLNEDIVHLWPRAVRRPGVFRWDLLLDPAEQIKRTRKSLTGEKRFEWQYWTANVNPSDRYVLCVPGSVKYRISPLDNTYDNLTVAGDWTDCGFNEGCVEAAVMSGRLAAHAISGSPALENIIGYDHP
jgi:uncharacterized protein with NAD-binding domain and iron-sulfur cluster